ncbi:uncharacterized protein LAESUDRAFT_711821 [Laetiporus sulphureus 93-53]|uniref:Uncharacterized protein n=1 Tax=Laetiporus sulphureus 93-53 TaxID=1314785 RepID=A0A165G8H2_9APHY|nr:uncharacterized protein LAESUDRAFT_711821 [Laetiporus sulphureus 93-53]KZT09975.1 hypothetical protein LAESUDRAFT_711821 [Laetiporus sulphureus 93-53]
MDQEFIEIWWDSCIDLCDVLVNLYFVREVLTGLGIEVPELWLDLRELVIMICTRMEMLAQRAAAVWVWVRPGAFGSDEEAPIEDDEAASIAHNKPLSVEHDEEESAADHAEMAENSCSSCSAFNAEKTQSSKIVFTLKTNIYLKTFSEPWDSSTRTSKILLVTQRNNLLKSDTQICPVKNVEPMGVSAFEMVAPTLARSVDSSEDGSNQGDKVQNDIICNNQHDEDHPEEPVEGCERQGQGEGFNTPEMYQTWFFDSGSEI